MLIFTALARQPGKPDRESLKSFCGLQFVEDAALHQIDDCHAAELTSVDRNSKFKKAEVLKLPPRFKYLYCCY
jgi:hypothetical protein